MERRRLVKRMRRRLWGGTVDFRFYSDNTIRARCDHPSNDPEIEFAMAGRVLKAAREIYGPGLTMQPMAWRDDPPQSASRTPSTASPADETSPATVEVGNSATRKRRSPGGR